MNDKYSDKKTQTALERFGAMKWNQTFCANQDSFETFTLTVRNGLRGDLAEILPEIGDLPFAHVNTMLVVIGFGAIREGARGLGSLTGERCTLEHVPQVEFGAVWEAATALGNPMSEGFAGLRKTLEQIPEIDAVLGAAEASLRDNLVGKFPALASHEQELKQILLPNLLNGVRLEYLYPLLIKEKQAEDDLMRRLTQEATAKKTIEGPALSRLKKKLGVSHGVHPWPLDLTCVCGAALAEQLICCDAKTPVDPASFADDLGPNFILTRPCCGASLTGFRCGTCARYYTWSRGTVPTLANP